MAHHVVEHAPALQRSLPEPGHVWSAVLLRGPSEVRTSRQRRSARPHQLTSTRDVGREELILEVARVEAYTLDHLDNLFRFGNVARQRLLASEPTQRTSTALDRIDDFLDVGEASMVRPAEPERVDSRVSDHIANGLVRPGLADIQLSGKRSGGRRVLLVRTPDSAHIDLSDRGQRLDVEAGVETAADEADAETLCSHFTRKREVRRCATDSGSEAQLAAIELGVSNTELLQRGGWAAAPIGIEDVSHVPQILNADFARPESRGGEIPEAIEEADAVSHAGRSLCRPGDIVENRLALRCGRIDERFSESTVRLGIDPGQAVAHPFLAVRPV